MCECVILLSRDSIVTSPQSAGMCGICDSIVTHVWMCDSTVTWLYCHISSVCRNVWNMWLYCHTCVNVWLYYMWPYCHTYSTYRHTCVNVWLCCHVPLLSHRISQTLLSHDSRVTYCTHFTDSIVTWCDNRGTPSVKCVEYVTLEYVTVLSHMWECVMWNMWLCCHTCLYVW